MNLNVIFSSKKIRELTYDSVFIEKPMSKIVDFDYKSILSAPPGNLSKTTQKELQLISLATNNRTEKDVNFVHKVDEDIDYFYIKLLNSYDLKYPQRYINLFYDIIEPILLNTKGFWNRPRPNQLAEKYGIPIDVIVTDTIHTASYPSGHTVYTKLVANILTDMYPKLGTALENISKNTANARIQQGVHYPSDNQASFVFTNYVYKKLNPKLLQYRGSDER